MTLYYDVIAADARIAVLPPDKTNRNSKFQLQGLK